MATGTRSAVQDRRFALSAQAVLLRRRGLVVVPSPAGAKAAPAGVALLEAELVALGYLLDAPLRAALAALDDADLAAAGSQLLGLCADAVGAGRVHTPLFSRFPHDVPTDALALWVERVLTILLQLPGAPCVLCGSEGSVQPVNPCAHLVCTACFEPGAYTACPICYRKLDGDDPYLVPTPPRSRRAFVLAPARLTVLHLAQAPADALAAGELAVLLARSSALSPADTDDVRALLATRSRSDLGFLPAQLASREAKALVVAWLVQEPSSAALAAAAGFVDTATDVLRVVSVLSGHSAGLVEVGRLSGLPRPIRRALLTLLEGCDPTRAAVDVLRHRRLWKHAFERLHPFEHAATFPTCAALAALVRGTSVPGTTGAVASALGTATASLAASVRHGKLTVRTPSAQAEVALAAGDAAAAADVLAARPGELLRRADHLLRVAAQAGDAAVEHVVTAALAALPAASPAVLVSVLGALRVRTSRVAQRVFFPGGVNARTYLAEDTRPLLPATLLDRVAGAVTAELLTRAAELPKVEAAYVDAALAGVVAPFAERTASRALVTLPRGSKVPVDVPSGGRLRLFCHWMEAPGQRVDLDLSVAFFDEEWAHVGTCDYTTLGWGRRGGLSGAVHSGDFTSAPAPSGASEFVDLDLASLRDAGARWALMSVLSYNNVPFVDLAEAFAGVMVWHGDPAAGEVFDPRSVEQRFDLAGSAKVAVPMLVDLVDGSLRWLDVSAGVHGTDHAVHRYSDNLAAIGSALNDLFGSGARVNVAELALVHAAGRAAAVVLRRDDGSLVALARQPEDTAAGFHARLLAALDVTQDVPDTTGAEAGVLADKAELVFTLAAGPGAPDAQVYAAQPGRLGADVTRLAAPDIAGSLVATG